MIQTLFHIRLNADVELRVKSQFFTSNLTLQYGCDYKYVRSCPIVLKDALFAQQRILISNLEPQQTDLRVENKKK